MRPLIKLLGRRWRGGWRERPRQRGLHREEDGIDLLTGWELQILNETFIEFINGCCHWDWPLEATRE